MATKIFKKPILPMTGATSSAAGESGLVPTPASGDDSKYLKGDGTWSTVALPSDMTGATSSTAGTHGLVPAPVAGDNEKYLCGNGSWTEIAGGAKIFTVQDTITGSGSYTGTINDNRVTADMKAIDIEYGTPSIVGADFTVTCNDGSLSLSSPSVVGTTTVTISVIKTIDDPTAITSSEYDALNNAKVDKTSFYATEMPVSTSDSTKVSASLSSLKQAIANKVGIGSENKAGIIATNESTNVFYINNTLSNNDIRQIQAKNNEIAFMKSESGTWSRYWTMYPLNIKGIRYITLANNGTVTIDASSGAFVFVAAYDGFIGYIKNDATIKTLGGTLPSGFTVSGSGNATVIKNAIGWTIGIGILCL